MKQKNTLPVLGYGCMRFPTDAQGALDREQAKGLILRALEGGIDYLDTAWPYHNGQSEPFLGWALRGVRRDRYCLATKLPCWEITSPEQAESIFTQQLERLNTEYFDFYLMHSLSRGVWHKMQELGIPDLLARWKAEGRIRNLGFSFHDSLSAFEAILTARPWDFCQIQLNYLDTRYQAGLAGLAKARALGIPVVVMEPLKGGLLANLPEDAQEPLRAVVPDRTPAQWAMRWVASQPGVAVILSGMSDRAQLEDNLCTFATLSPLSPAEQNAVAEAAARLRRRVRNGCTGCRYCMPCPAGVDIPGNFQLWNQISMFRNRAAARRAWSFFDPEERPDHCVSCGRCETLCPQHLPIRADLAKAGQEISEFVP